MCFVLYVTVGDSWVFIVYQADTDKQPGNTLHSAGVLI